MIVPYRYRRRTDHPGTLDRGLGLLVALAGCWALALALITIIGVQVHG